MADIVGVGAHDHPSGNGDDGGGFGGGFGIVGGRF